MYNHPFITLALFVSIVSAASCSKQEERPGGEAAPAHQNKSDTEAQAEIPSIWPDGYLVVSEAEWIPVINEAGKELEAAHQHFVVGETDMTVADLRAASKAIREDQKMVEPDEKGILEQSAKELDRLAEEVIKGKVDYETLEKALVKAYRDDVRISWLYSEDEAIRPYLDRPSEHSARALAMLARHDNAGAAAEIRRNTAFFRLGELSARPDDREILQHNVDRLNAMAKRADAGKLTPDELRQMLAKVDAAYAASYLHQAEDDYLGRRKQVQRAPRALREAVARMRSRLRMLDEEMKETSTAVIDELETMTGDLERGAEVGARDAAKVFERAHDQVKAGAGDRAKATGHVASRKR